VTPPTFEEFVRGELAALRHRAAIKELERQNGEFTDEMGRYWLARTAALERVAYEAGQTTKWTRPHPLEKALEALERIPAPACREGDHASDRAA
jgi:hypothetical protein